jgi:hypothetical protein
LRKEEAAASPDANSKPAWETSTRPTGEHQVSCGIPTATPGINQHSSLDRLTPCPEKNKTKNLNNKQGTEKEHKAEGSGCCKCTRERGRGKELISS